MTYAPHRAGNPRPHVHPPLLRARPTPPPGAVGVFSGGSLLYGATGRPDLLGARAHPRAGPPPARLGPPARRAAARRRRGLPDPRVRVVLLRHPVRCHVLDHRPGEAVQPGPDPGRADLRRRVARRPRRLAGVLRHMAPSQRRRPVRARPVPPGRRRRRPSCAGASRPGSGSSTCATAPRSPPATRPARSTSVSTAASRPTSAGSSRGAPRSRCSARPPEDVAEAQRELVRIGIDRPAAHATGGPRTGPTATLTSFPTGDVRRPGPGAPPPRGRRPRRAPRRRARRRAHRRRGQRPAPRAPGAASTRSRPARCGCTAPAATAPRSPPPSRRRRAHPRRDRRHLRQRRAGRPPPRRPRAA